MRRIFELYISLLIRNRLKKLKKIEFFSNKIVKLLAFKLVFVLLFLFQVQDLFSQSKNELEQQKTFLLQEIKESENLLSSTRIKKSDKLNELNLLDRKINSRQKLIANLKSKINLLNQQIDTTTTSIENLKNESSVLKENYAQMIKAAYKKRNSNSLWFFVFSANNFNAAIKRYKYLSQYANYRKQQLKIIENNTLKLERSKKRLSAKLLEVEQSKSDEKQQSNLLKKEKQKKDLLLNDLAKQEKRILDEIQAKKKERDDLSNKIKNIIAEEIAAAKAKAQKLKNASSDKGKKVYALTPEAKALANSFYLNKGKFPWPVERGYISEKFGKHKHKYLKRVTTHNKGINIATQKNAIVKSIYNGKVINVFKMPLLQTIVLVAHGDYFTVYGNIKDSFVKRGDSVKTKQSIGTVYTNPKDGKTEVHLEIWKGEKNLNPAYWLKKK